MLSAPTQENSTFFLLSGKHGAQGLACATVLSGLSGVLTAVSSFSPLLVLWVFPLDTYFVSFLEFFLFIWFSFLNVFLLYVYGVLLACMSGHHAPGVQGGQRGC